MSSIPRTTKTENESSDFVANFMKEFQVGKLIFQCNTEKLKGIPVGSLPLSVLPHFLWQKHVCAEKDRRI